MSNRERTMPSMPAATSGPRRGVTRRRALVALAGCLAGEMTAAPQARAWHSNDVASTLPHLNFTMTRASDGKEVSAADYRGKVVLLYFGYTFCPDICPTTLFNLTMVLKRLGPLADDARTLFVTVDPARDTLDLLKQYAHSFAPQTVALRGTADQLAALAKRYRVAYSVEPAAGDRPYEVTHSSGVFVFDRNGDLRLLFSDAATVEPDLDGLADDLRALIGQTSQPSLWQRILSLL